MDSITHITLGACIGEIVLGKKLGKKALFWGVLAQSLPDIDALFTLFCPADEGFLVHRGITHSLLFALLSGLLLAIITSRAHRRMYLSFGLLATFFCGQVMLHDLLDTCNSYGTALLEPFSKQRFSLNLLYVADPLFSKGIIFASLFLIFKRTNNRYRVKCAWAAIGWSAVYLCLAGASKVYIDNRIERSFAQQNIKSDNYFTTPTPFNSMLWYVVAATDSSYYTSYTSIWDSKARPVQYEFHPKNYDLLKDVNDRQLVNNLITFADGYYTVSQVGNIKYLNVLRFEQIQGWRIPNAPFAFSYPLSGDKDQGMLLQKGRMKGWNKDTFVIYLKRIAGKPDDR